MDEELGAPVSNPADLERLLRKEFRYPLASGVYRIAGVEAP